MESLIDANCWLGSWPFQVFTHNSAAALAEHLASEEITTALVSPTEAILHPDPNIFNDLLINTVEDYPLLKPVPVVNPTLANWKTSMAIYASTDNVHSIRILPNYHNYSLNAPCVRELMMILAELAMPLMIQIRMEDERSQYPLMQVAGVSCDEIIELAERFPDVSIICLGAYFNEAIGLLLNSWNVYVDISFIDKINTLNSLLERTTHDRIVFGSHTPFFYTRSAVLKADTGGILPDAARAIISENISLLLSGERP